MAKIAPGMLVYGPTGRIGIVSSLAPSETPTRLIIETDKGIKLTVPAEHYDVQDGIVRLTNDGAANDTQTTASEQSSANVADDDALVIPVVAEQVRIERRIVEGGGVRVHKQIVEREEVIEQPTFREEISVERVAIDRPIEVAPEPRQEGDTLVIPVVEEVVFIEKRLVLKEELRITRHRIEETKQIQVVVRAEQAEIEQFAPESRSHDLGDTTVA